MRPSNTWLRGLFFHPLRIPPSYSGTFRLVDLPFQYRIAYPDGVVYQQFSWYRQFILILER